MILIGESRIIRKKFFSSATLSITNLTWTDLRSNPGDRGVKLATVFYIIYKDSFYILQEHSVLPFK